MGENLGAFLGRNASALWTGFVLSSGVAFSAPHSCPTELLGVRTPTTSEKFSVSEPTSFERGSEIDDILSTISDFVEQAKHVEAEAAYKSAEEHWSAVGLQFEALRAFVGNEKCYRSEMHFLMCIGALRGILRFASHAQTLAPRERKELFLLFGKVIEPHGPIDLVEAKEVQVTDASIVPQTVRALELALRKAWIAQYRSSSAKIDFEALLELYRTRHVPTARESYITASAINEALSQADAHARLETVSHLKQSQRSSNQDLVGVGIVFGKHEGAYVVTDLFADSAAEQAGLKARDQIIAIDKEPIANLSLNEAHKRIRGATGTPVEFTILRGGDTLTFSLIRKAIRVDNVRLRIFRAREAIIGYIRLSSFMDPKAPEDIAKAITSAKAQGANALVLDLRQNLGGLLTAAVDIAGYFMGSGKIAVIQKSLIQGRKDMKHVTTKDKLSDLSLVLLVDAASASASELLSGALQESGDALLVGERTFGKGTVQSCVDLSSLGPELTPLPILFWRTVARFILPSGRTNQICGVEPDLAVARTPEGDPTKSATMREEDIFPNALPPEGEPPRPSFQFRNEWVKKCIEKTGQSRELFRLGTPSELPLDYQLLYALDAAKCLDQYTRITGWKNANRLAITGP